MNLIVPVACILFLSLGTQAIIVMDNTKEPATHNDVDNSNLSLSARQGTHESHLQQQRQSPTVQHHQNQHQHQPQQVQMNHHHLPQQQHLHQLHQQQQHHQDQNQHQQQQRQEHQPTRQHTHVRQQQQMLQQKQNKQRYQQPQHQLPAEDSNAESTKEVKGFRSVVVHKPSSTEDESGGLTVQDPPKGWPFSEIHMNFNSHSSDNEVDKSSIVTARPEDVESIGLRPNSPPQQLRNHQNQNRVRQNRQHQQIESSQLQHLHSQHFQTNNPLLHVNLQQGLQQQQSIQPQQLSVQPHASIVQSQFHVNPSIQSAQPQPIHIQSHQGIIQAQPLVQPNNHIVQAQQVALQPQTHPVLTHQNSISQQSMNGAENVRLQHIDQSQQHPIPSQRLTQHPSVHHQASQTPQSHASHNQQTNTQQTVRQNAHSVHDANEQYSQSHRAVYRKPPSPVANEHQQSHVSEIAAPGVIKLPRRRPNPSPQSGYNNGLSTSSDSSAHSNQQLGSLNKEASSIPNRLRGQNGVQQSSVHSHFSQQAQKTPSLQVHQTVSAKHPSNPQSSQQESSNAHDHQATSNMNFHNTPSSGGDPNYVWRDVGQGLEISSNALGGTQHNSVSVAKASQNVAQGSPFPLQNSGVQSHASYYFSNIQGSQGLHGQTFDHANALGHSDNFGYRDAILPEQGFGQQQSTISQIHSAGQGSSAATQNTIQNTFYQNINQEQIAQQDNDRGIAKTSYILPGIKKNTLIGTSNAPHVPYSLGLNHQTQNLANGQKNIGDITPNQKVVSLLKVNKGLVPGSLVLGNGVHVGYAAANIGQHGAVISPQSVVSTGTNSSPVQAFYLPLPGLQGGQISHQTPQHTGNTGVQQQSEQQHQQQPQQQQQHQQQLQPGTPSLLTGIPGAIPAGYVNTAALPYAGLSTLNGYSGNGGLPIIHSNIIGLQQIPLGGASFQPNQLGNLILGGTPYTNGGLQAGTQNSFLGNHQGLNQQQHQGSQQASAQQQFVQAAPGLQGNLQNIKDPFNHHNSFPYYQQLINNQQNQLVKPQLNPSGFGIKLQQPQSLPQQNLKSGIPHKLQTSGRPHPLSTSFTQVFGHPSSLARGYQGFTSPGSELLNGNKMNSLKPQIYNKFPFPLSMGKVDDNVNKKNVGFIRDRSSVVWSGNPIPLKPIRTTSTSQTTPFVLGMKPPATIS